MFREGGTQRQPPRKSFSFLYQRKQIDVSILPTEFHFLASTWTKLKPKIPTGPKIIWHEKDASNLRKK